VVTAPTVPITESITELFESLQPPCHFEHIHVDDGPGVARRVVHRTPCDKPAKWIVRAVFECGLSFAIAGCDPHHKVILVPNPHLFCPTHLTSEPIHDVLSDAL
jgi:hypothetical protein